MQSANKVMVCVTQQKSCERLIDEGKKLASNPKDQLYVVHAIKENWKYFGKLKEADALEYLFEVSKKRGAELSVLNVKDIESALSDFAQKYDIDIIVMGESLEVSAQQNMINRLQTCTSKNVEFHVVPISDLSEQVG